ncbi:unnamed protein product [Ranitomeya imitator]|uniref:Uncharacterized protein n=1 Tax=Ranitomeya imitator TaxID=111125 RepID=A0ABN9LTR7_9NEOB|nr:unnamed protein product [Ranitomeya imitator]
MEDLLVETLCHLVEMCTCHQEMMATVVKTGMTVTLAEIMEAPGTPEITHHLQETMHIGTMATRAPVTIMAPEDMVIVMDTGVEIEIIRIMLVVVHTETLMSLTVTHVVPHLPEAPLHHMVAAVAMMITAALEMDTEAETVTPAAEMISTQVVDGNELADRNVACHHQWIEVTHLHVIHTAAQVAVSPVVPGEVEADLIEEVAEADIKTDLDMWSLKIKHNLDMFGVYELVTRSTVYIKNAAVLRNWLANNIVSFKKVSPPS